MKTEPTPRWASSGSSNEAPGNGFRHHVPGSFYDEQPVDSEPRRRTKTSSSSEPAPAFESSGTSRTWPPRTCRICLETVQPTYHMPSENLPGFLQSSSRVTYESEDLDSGPLISPCKCRGSSRFVHTGCLQTWRYAKPGFGNLDYFHSWRYGDRGGDRNYYNCPTCGFCYRLQRMGWGRLIRSRTMEISLTVGIFMLAMFLLGFVADPIINLYLDPYDTITSGVGKRDEPLLPEDYELNSWSEHFIKGLASLGLLGFVKVFFALTPWQWWNIRSSGVLNGGSRAGSNGRGRSTQVNTLVIVLGVCTFLWTVYKGVRIWSRKTLEAASEKVMDIPQDGEEEFEESPGQNAKPAQ